MAILANKRSIMTLFSGVEDFYSHRTRIVLAEKGVTVDVIEIGPQQQKPESLLELNPYGSVPTLVDRDLVLYDSNIIMEYLDERFPHPPLLPVYPVARAKSRLMISRIQQDWCSLLHKIQQGGSEEVLAAYRKELLEGLLSVSPIFADTPFFLSEEFSLIDCTIAPILWRLPALDIKLPPAKSKAIKDYSDRVFERDSFQASLTDVERELRDK
jgi:stringent starvation protein A